MEKQKFNTRMIVFAGMLIALEIIFTRVIQITLPAFEASKDRISIGFFPVTIAGMMFGPIGGGLIAAVADILRALIFPLGGAMNPLFTVTACLRGVIYGLFLHKRVDAMRITLASLIIFVFVNVGLNSFFTSISYGGTFMARVITKAPIACINYAIQMTLLLLALPPIQRGLNQYARK